METIKWLVFLSVFLCTVNFAVSQQYEKAGDCPRQLNKRNLYGTDACNDQCQDDTDCQGLRKCCTDGCRRGCKLPVLKRAPPTQQCPQGEEYDYCGPCRQATCNQPVANRTTCVSGCTCPPGYIRNSNGRCVKPKDCPSPPPPAKPVCAGRHEIYHECYQHCQGSCANLKADGCIFNACVTGCFCAPGYVRNGLGRCIHPSSCQPRLLIQVAPAPLPPTCPNGQEFSTCRRECEPTCANPMNDGSCVRPCQVGCFCRSPLVRDYYGNCIQADQCPTQIRKDPICIGNYEKFVLCSPKCQATCYDTTAQNCNSQCLTGCFCQDGFLRHEGSCITVDQCPPPPVPPTPPTPSTPICENDLEEFISCFRGCEKTCNPSSSGCQNDQCVSGCFCLSHLVRNHLGQCVDQSQCQGCGFNEHFEDCGPNCQSTCPQTTCETKNNCQAGCYCDNGYVKNVTDGNCIPTTQCQTNTGVRNGCGADEESVNCGSRCAQECENGWSSPSCPSNCRRRCCRRLRR